MIHQTNLSRHQRSSGTQGIAGASPDSILWSPVERFHKMGLAHLEKGMRGVYVIRYRDDPNQLKLASVLYISASDRCIKSALLADYLGYGNQFLPDFVNANPLGIYFQYTRCNDPKNAETDLIRALGHPICN
ncbi:MAG: hypothetical protein F6K30_16460 [Cyanothece sp. SIO2G6]|nr:hypothetical protein [Cyanothece sp. SIO2G6]